jgi:hypothetical protein
MDRKILSENITRWKIIGFYTSQTMLTDSLHEDTGGSAKVIDQTLHAEESISNIRCNTLKAKMNLSYI